MRPLLATLAALLAADITVADLGGDRLTVRSTAAVADLGRLPGGRQLIRLPALEFTLTVEARCDAGFRAESVSVTVADTRQRFGADDLNDDARIETIIRVPRQQLAPVATERFCSVEDAAASGTSLLLAAAMTAHVSLRCARNEEHAVYFEAAPLDVRLVCGPGSDADDDGAQEASAGDRF